MAEFEYKLSGFDGFIKEISRLTHKMQRSTARKAARKAMIPVRDAARANARSVDDPATAEKIYRNIAIQERSKTGRQIGGVAMSVGVRGGGRQGGAGSGGDTFYWRFLEFGTAKMPAHPILRPAFGESEQQQAINILSDELWKGISNASTD